MMIGEEEILDETPVTFTDHNHHYPRSFFHSHTILPNSCSTSTAIDVCCGNPMFHSNSKLVCGRCGSTKLLHVDVIVNEFYNNNHKPMYMYNNNFMLNNNIYNNNDHGCSVETERNDEFDVGSFFHDDVSTGKPHETNMRYDNLESTESRQEYSPYNGFIQNYNIMMHNSQLSEQFSTAFVSSSLVGNDPFYALESHGIKKVANVNNISKDLSEHLHVNSGRKQSNDKSDYCGEANPENNAASSCHLEHKGSSSRRRSAPRERLNYIRQYCESGPWSRIRVWKNEKNQVYYDCFCGKRVPIQHLKKIKRHAESHDIMHYTCDTCGREFDHYLKRNAHQKTHKRDAVSFGKTLIAESFPRVQEVTSLTQ